MNIERIPVPNVCFSPPEFNLQQECRSAQDLVVEWRVGIGGSSGKRELLELMLSERAILPRSGHIPRSPKAAGFVKVQHLNPLVRKL